MIRLKPRILSVPVFAKAASEAIKWFKGSRATCSDLAKAASIYTAKVGTINVVKVATINAAKVATINAAKVATINVVKVGIINVVKVGIINVVKVGIINVVKVGTINEVKVGTTNEVKVVLIIPCRFSGSLIITIHFSSLIAGSISVKDCHPDDRPRA